MFEMILNTYLDIALVSLLLTLKNYFSDSKYGFNPFQLNVAFHVETSHFFYRKKQMTGFCMERNIGLKCVNNLR